MQLQLSPDHFNRAISMERARSLFKASVHLVEIEAFTFCNRKCYFCPNAHIDRRSGNKYMDEALYLRILSELASIQYDKVITYSRYNEPLADRIILERLRQAREALPEAQLYTHTNGDYLNLQYLDELRANGLNTLRVQVYLSNSARYSEEKIVARMHKRLKALGLPYEMIINEPNVRHMALVHYQGMEVTFDARNFDILGTDRAQSLEIGKRYQRTSPCFIPFQQVYFDYNGSVVPCCNIRSDEASHQNYIVDDLSTGRSIFEAYANSSLADWRRDLLTFGHKKPPCDTCSYEAPDYDLILATQLEQISHHISGKHVE